MRKIILLAFPLLVLFFYSCKKGESGGDGGQQPVPNPALTISLSKNQLRADGFDEVTITVKDQNNNDVTSSSTLYINNSATLDPKFYTATPGTYNIYASKGGVNSSTITLNAQDPGPSPFSQKVLIEDYTGTWCGYCPRVGVNLANYTATRPNYIAIGIHGPAGSSDPYNYQHVTALTNAFSVTGWPTAIVNRDFKWNEQNSVLDQQGTKRAPLGLAFETSVNGNNINVKARIKFDVTTLIPMRIIVMLVEDGLVHPQVNYYAPTYGPNPISNYVHNHTLRTAATDIFGELIPSAQQVSGQIWEKNYVINAAGYNINNCKIVATVLFDAASGRKGSLNTQIVTVGQNKNFD